MEKVYKLSGISLVIIQSLLFMSAEFVVLITFNN